MEEYREKPQINLTERKPDIFDRIMTLPVLRIFEPFYRRFKQVLLYLFFGGLTTVVSIGSFWYFCECGIHELIANVLSWILAVLFAYITNSIWVFTSSPASWKERLKQCAGFFGGRVATLGMEEVILLVGISLLKFPALPVKILAQVLVLIGNYIISKFFVFR